jgi:phage protein D
MPDPSRNQIQSSIPRLFVAGERKQALEAELHALIVRESVEGLYRCEATFGNWNYNNDTRQAGFLFFDRKVLDFGKQFEVKLDDDSVFDGRITGIEAQFPAGQAATITVLAEDRFQDLRMTRRTRTFFDKTESSVFNEIASDHGLTPSISLNGPTHKVLAQVNQSDLAFMRERARVLGAELWMTGSTLNVKARADRGATTLQMTLGSELLEFDVLADLARQRTSVSANGWDVSGKSGATYEATASLISGELNGDTSGVSILEQQFGARKEALAHGVPFDNAEAQSEAESYFKMSARRFCVGRGVAGKNAALRVGNVVDLRALGPLFSGKYYLAEVTHLFDLAKGFRTEFTAERPGIGQAQ